MTFGMAKRLLSLLPLCLLFGILLYVLVATFARMTPETELGITAYTWPAVSGVLLLVGAGLYLHQQRRRPDILRPSMLWACLLLALCCELICPQPWTDAAMVGLSLSLTAGVAIVTIALLRYWALIFWLPFMLMILGTSYAKFSMNLVLTPYVMAQIIGASPEDAAPYFTFGNIAAFILLLLALVAALVVVIRACRRQPRKPMLVFGTTVLSAAVCMVVEVPTPFSYEGKAALGAPNTAYNIFQTAFMAQQLNSSFLEKAKALPSPADKPSSIDTLKGDEGVICILHIGESTRADHMQFNGYSRHTTPWLASRRDLINFPDCSSVGIYTSYALAGIVTDSRGNMAEELSPELEPTCGSMMDLFAANGFTCYGFFTNQKTSKENPGNIIFEELLELFTKSAKKVYTSEDYGHFDQNSKRQIPFVMNVFNETQGNVFCFLANTGSHTPFHGYDEPVFSPSDPDALRQSPHKNAESAQKVINAYDNTVLYTDEYIHDLVTALEGKPFIYVYIGDHGEPLGENDEWTRGTRKYHKYQWSKVPFFVIASPEFETLHPHFAQAVDQLRRNADKRTAHEHIFHTMLGIFGIHSPYYKPELDLSSPGVEEYTGPHPQNDGQSADTLTWE